MSIQIVTFAQRPDLVSAIWSQEFRSSWPAFITGDLIADLYYDSFFLAEPPFLEYGLIAFDESAPHLPLARAFSVPFAFGEGSGRTVLPSGGWDQLVVWADDDLKSGVVPSAVSAIEINVRPDARGRHLSGRMLDAIRQNARRLGFQDVYAPVRPTAKHLEPHTPMSEYAYRTREDGLPSDPWLRVHIRAGGHIVKIAQTSMVIAGSLEQWRHWTDLPFDQTGDVAVPHALALVKVALEHDYAVYVEPNVWIHHSLV
jgi:GNAT superfamily N-acetyltransferase